MSLAVKPETPYHNKVSIKLILQQKYIVVAFTYVKRRKRGWGTRARKPIILKLLFSLHTSSAIPRFSM